MAAVSTESGAFQDLDRIHQRIDYDSLDFYDEGDNAALRFDNLLVELEAESRGIFVTLWGDQTPLTQTDREDVIRPPDDAALPLVYPIKSIGSVEYKRTLGMDWDDLDTDWYTHTEHRLILAERPNVSTVRRQYNRGNPLTDNAERTTWGDFAAELRVTYDRGFGEQPPNDVLSVQVALVENMLASRKLQETVSAGTPEDIRQTIDAGDVVTESIRDRIGDVTKPGMATVSV